MAGLAILKATYNLSDDVLCERWVENLYYQLFCSEEFFQHRLPFDRSSLARWRQSMGEDKLTASRPWNGKLASEELLNDGHQVHYEADTEASAVKRSANCENVFVT